MIRRILYLGWLRHGNVGDDLLYLVFKQIILKQSYTANTCIAIDEYYDEYEVSLSQYNLIVLGGGSLLTIPYYMDICTRGQSENIPIIVWGSGIDIRRKKNVDEILSLYTKNPLGIINQKALEDISQIIRGYNEMCKIIKNAKIVSVRGNMTRIFLDRDDVEVIKDPGIIFDKLGFQHTVQNEIHNFISGSSNVVLVNWGSANNNIIGNNEEEVENQLRNVIKVLLVKRYKVIIYPILSNDINVCKKFSSQLNSNNVFCVNKVYDVFGICGLIHKCKFTINFKLHASILSMALSRPFICLAYGFKCFDFAESINASQLLLSTDKVTLSALLDKVNYIEDNYTYIQESFMSKINEIYENQISYIKRVIEYIRSID